MPFLTVGPPTPRKGQARDPALESVKIYYRTYGQGDCKVMMIMGVAATGLAWWPQIKTLTGTDTPNEPDEPESLSSDDDDASIPMQSLVKTGSSEEGSSSSPGSSEKDFQEALRCKSDLGHRLMLHGAESLASRLEPIMSPGLAPSSGSSGSSLVDLDEGEQVRLAEAVEAELSGCHADVCGDIKGGVMQPPHVFERLDADDIAGEQDNQGGAQEGYRDGCDEGPVLGQQGNETEARSAKQLTGRVVCVFDNRGVGRSSHPVDLKNYRTEIMARDALALADQLGWKRFHVIGHSMGGMIACKLAAAVPLRVKSLAIISSSCGGTDILPKLNLRTWSLLARMVRAHSPEERAAVDLDTHFSKSFLSEMVGGAPRRQELHREYVCTLGSKGALQPKHAQHGQVMACWNHGLSTSDIHHICEANIPVSVIHGSADMVADVSLGQGLARKLHEVARFVELHGGHMIVRERVDEVNHFLVELISAAQLGVRGRAWVASDKTREQADVDTDDCRGTLSCGRLVVC